uniref:Uncharacterized protein n=1 Tax=mine drainage metagenome TaxID=410659 RepID=E6QSS3_9ZZZZ
MAIRIKTTWFKQENEPKGPEKQATVLATTIWKLADRAVTDLSKADYDIITPQRGFGLLAELSAFMIHMSDRMVYRRITDGDRQTLIQVTAVRLAEILEDNIHEIINDHEHPYQAAFIDLVNRRGNDYAEFEFSPEQPSFLVLRYLGNCIRDIMQSNDQSWVIDQIMEVQAPDMVPDLIKTVDGLFPHSPNRVLPTT